MPSDDVTRHSPSNRCFDDSSADLIAVAFGFVYIFEFFVQHSHREVESFVQHVDCRKIRKYEGGLKSPET